MSTYDMVSLVWVLALGLQVVLLLAFERMNRPK
jgi:hypothetical protein